METTMKIATGGIADEFRKLAVGEEVLFPLSEYNYNSVRATQSTTMVNDRAEGKKWKTRIDYDNKGVIVTRIA